MTTATEHDYSLMVHGGAGAMDHVKSDREAVRYLESIRTILEHGRAVLARGAPALEAVEVCCALLEDDPLYNAGCGSVLNEDGKVEMDAAIMDGATLKAGAVAAVHNVANPIQLAWAVLEHSEHVMLIGEGALRFARQWQVPWTPDHYFLTEERVKQFEQARRFEQMGLDHDRPPPPENKFGTVGCVARDVRGNLAAGTSTGGIVNKRFGRVGDSPIVGAGVWADNASCAVSATGYGEDFMRTVLCKTVADLIEFKGLIGPDAVEEAIAYLTRKVQGRGGIILIDHRGRCASGMTTRKMIHGWIENGGETVCRF